MMSGVILISIIVGLAIFFVTANLLYKKMEQIKLIPIKYHPYTSKKTKEFYWEFIRSYFMFLCTIVFLISGYFKVFLGLLIISVLHAVSVYLIYKKNKVEQNERIEVVYDDRDIKEQKEFIEKESVKGTKKVVTVEKIVFYNDYLYISKNKKILTRERMYKYIFLHQARKEEQLLILKYGFMGMPMFEKRIYIPRRKEREMLKILHRIDKSKKYLNFTDKYMNVFKKNSN